MPRLDRFRQLHPTLPPGDAGSAVRDHDSPRDPELRSYRSGFWATVPIEPRDRPGTVELCLEAILSDGTTQRDPLGTIEVVERTARPPHGDDAKGRRVIAICMATFNPDAELFRAQVESIRAQTYADWICIVSDDCSEPERFAAIERIIAGDERFLLTRAERQLGFYRNFERALSLVPPDAELVALSDHDDRWYPDKLEALAEAIGSARLAYSDVRRVDSDGQVLAETLWDGRRNNRTNLASLLISNTIVGASCLFRREVIDYAVPFPSGPGLDFHDHWLALVAMALGEVAYVDRPLYDYVRHPQAVLGRTGSTTAGGRRGGLLDRWRSAYFWLYRQREFHAQVLLARCAAELEPRKRRALRLMAAAESSPIAFAWLATRPLRALFGRNETLLAEQTLLTGVLWRYLIALRTWRRERPGRGGSDASFPALGSTKLGRRQRRWLTRT